MALKKNLGRSTAWMSAAASGNSVVSFIIFIVLSRILAPAEIGLVAFALIFVEMGKIIVNAGLPQAIVQNKVWDETYASTCFYLNLVFALFITLLVYFVGAPLASQHYDPQAGPILQVLSLVFFIEAIKAVHEGKLKREFLFRAIAVRTVVSSMLSGIVGIYMALNGYGVWALVGQQLVSQCVLTIITLISTRWMPKLKFSFTDFKQLMRFSSPLMIAQLIGNVSAKIFELLVGIFIGPAALGFLRVGGRALFILQDIVLKPFEQTALSALARIPEKSQQAAAAVRLIRMSAYLTFPIFFGAAAVGPEFITLAFGQKWAVSGHLMTILAIGIAPTVIGYQINSALTASGNSKMVMSLAAIVFVINCSIAALSVPFGLYAATIGFGIRTYITIFFNMYYFRKVFGIHILYILKAAAPSFLASAIMFGVVMAVKIMYQGQLPVALNLILLGILGAVIYIILMVTLFRAETRNFFIESIDLSPAKFKPLMIRIQRLIKLDR